MDADGTVAEAFAYDADGIIVAVGSEPHVRNEVGDNFSVIDGGEATVVPGFQDAHVHVPEAGINLEVCYLPRGLEIDDYEALIADCAAADPDAEWVRAAGASLFDLREASESPLDVVDRAVPDRPAVILDDLGHAVWTNSLGLQAAGISAEEPDPQGGVLHRDAAGNLTGLLLEDTQQLVRNAATPSDDVIYEGLLVAMEELAANGVTTISDAGGYWAQNHAATWQRAESEGRLTVRAMNTLYVYPDLGIDEQLAEFERRFSNQSDLLRFDTAKIYIDGIIDLGTASLIEPYDYAIEPDYPRGFNYFEPDQLAMYVNELHQLGYRINFHVIGDQAARDALDAVTDIDDEPEAIADRRHRTTHTYLVDPTDRPRYAELGVIADMQQSPDAIAPDYHDELTEVIGDRSYDLIPTADLVDAGATVILSSDWDAGPLSPLETIERALMRDSQAVSDLESALAMHTIDAAYALGHDDTTGSIEVGKFADFVVLDRNLFDLELADIAEARVRLTVVGGDTVYRSDS